MGGHRERAPSMGKITARESNGGPQKTGAIGANYYIEKFITDRFLNILASDVKSKFLPTTICTSQSGRGWLACLHFLCVYLYVYRDVVCFLFVFAWFVCGRPVHQTCPAARRGLAAATNKKKPK